MKILLLQLKRIGDLILTTPAIRCLREAYPDAHITLAVDASCQGLLEGISADTFWVHHKNSGWGGLWGAGPNAWMRRELWGFSGDLCLDFTGTDRSAGMTLASGCRKRLTFARFRRKFARRFLYTEFIDSSVRERHTSDHYTDLLRPLGINRENIPLDLKIPPAVAARVRTLLNEKGVRGPFAVIHAGTARPEKYWQAERWAAITDRLAAEGVQVVLTGSKDAEEQKHLQAIQKAGSSPAVDLSGQTNLLELAALIGEADLFCGVDTAAMHLADAMHTPTVALFGPTNPFHWRPRHAPATVLRADTEAPFCPGQKGGGMADLSITSVWTAVEKLRALRRG